MSCFVYLYTIISILILLFKTFTKSATQLLNGPKYNTIHQNAKLCHAIVNQQKNCMDFFVLQGLKIRAKSRNFAC